MTDEHRFHDERDEVLAVLSMLSDLDQQADPLDDRALESLTRGAATEPPSGLLDDVLRAARRRRTEGPASGPPPESVSAVEAFRRVATNLHALLTSLDADEWGRPTETPYGAVHDVVAHLVGIERLALGWFGVLPMPPDDVAFDHALASAAAMEELAGTSTDALVGEWYKLALRVATTARSAPSDMFFMAHDIPASPDVAMQLRTFELWAHTDDIAVALGRPLLMPDPGIMLTLSSALAQALPFTFGLAGEDSPNAGVRLVLTGPGGGTYDLGFGDAPPMPTASTIVVAAYDACRLAQRRAVRSDVDVVVEGDVSLGESILAHAGVFARD